MYCLGLSTRSHNDEIA